MIPDSIEKINRSQWLTFLDVSNTSTPSWKVLGIGITDYSVDYNPQVDTEKWIIEDNARSDHTANEKQGSVTQKTYKGDELFEFVANGRDQLNYKTHILDIDRWNGTGTGTSATYPAKLSDGKIVITSILGENSEIEYDIYYDGEATDVTVTIGADGQPTIVTSL